MNREIKAHYGSDDLAAKIFESLAKAGKEPDNLELKDLSVIDQLHTGGHLSTLELARKVGISKEHIVLDAGCGIGGSSRLLAQTFGCKVTGVDLTPSFIDVAEQLAKSTRTSDLVSFVCADILNTSFLNNSFDVIWCQHTLMNINEKSAAFAEFRRVLKVGGIVVLHEIIKGNGEDIYLPVPWAATPDISLLISMKQMDKLIVDNGFSCRFLEDRTDQAKMWWDKVYAATQKRANLPPAPLGPHIIFGDNGKLFGQTMSKNVNEGRIKLIEGVYVKS